MVEKFSYSLLLRVFCALFSIFGVAFSLFTLFRILTTFELQDFAVYHRAANDLLVGENPYQISEGEPFIYPPTALLFLAPLGLFTRSVAENIWTISSFASAVAIVILLTSILIPKASLSRFIEIGILIHALIWFSFPAKFTLGMGQVNFFVLFLVVSSFVLYSKKRLVGAGIALACATALKLSPLVVLFFYLRKKQWQVVSAYSVGLIVLSFFAVMSVGWETFIQYWQVVLPSLPTVGNGAYYNQAFTGFLARAGVTELGSVLNAMMFGFLLLVSWITTQQNQQEFQFELAEYSLFLLVVLIGGGLTWQHHLVGATVSAVAFTWLLLHACQKKIWSKKMLITQSFGGFAAYFLVAYNSKESLILAEKSTELLSHGLYGVVLFFILLVVALTVLSKKNMRGNC